MCFKFFSKKKKSSYPSFADSITPFPNEKPIMSGDSSTDLEASFLRNVNSARDYDATKADNLAPQTSMLDYDDDDDYDFLLSEVGGKIETDSRKIKNPTETDIRNAVDNLTLYDGDFFTLYPFESINGYTSMGAMSEYDTDLITVDISKEAGTRGDKDIEKVYEKLVSGEELFKLMKDFLNGRTPDADDGTWTFAREEEY